MEQPAGRSSGQRRGGGHSDLLHHNDSPSAPPPNRQQHREQQQRDLEQRDRMARAAVGAANAPARQNQPEPVVAQAGEAELAARRKEALLMGGAAQGAAARQGA